MSQSPAGASADFHADKVPAPEPVSYMSQSPAGASADFHGLEVRPRMDPQKVSQSPADPMWVSFAAKEFTKRSRLLSLF